MMLVVASAGDVQRSPGIVGKGLEEVEEQLGGQVAYSLAAKFSVPNEPRAAREVNRGLGQGLIHRQQKAVAGQTALVAKRLREGCA